MKKQVQVRDSVASGNDLAVQKEKEWEQKPIPFPKWAWFVLPVSGPIWLVMRGIQEHCKVTRQHMELGILDPSDPYAMAEYTFGGSMD